MPVKFNAFDWKEWEETGLQDFGEFCDLVEYVNQVEDGWGSEAGEWFYIPENPLPGGKRVIYFGTFGSDHSPGASAYTYAEVFDLSDPNDVKAFSRRRAAWESLPEYID